MADPEIWNLGSHLLVMNWQQLCETYAADPETALQVLAAEGFQVVHTLLWFTNHSEQQLKAFVCVEDMLQLEESIKALFE